MAAEQGSDALMSAEQLEQVERQRDLAEAEATEEDRKTAAQSAPEEDRPE